MKHRSDREINEAISRVAFMEGCLNEVKEALDLYGRVVLQDKTVQEKLQILRQYMDSGLWLRDYILDEQGGLPSDLKRGVLSQDTLYDLLCEVSDHNPGH